MQSALAHQALTTNDKIGTMLLCNVIVQDLGGGKIEVAAIDPAISMAQVGNPMLKTIAEKPSPANLSALSPRSSNCRVFVLFLWRSLAILGFAGRDRALGPCIQTARADGMLSLCYRAAFVVPAV